MALEGKITIGSEKGDGSPIKRTINTKVCFWYVSIKKGNISGEMCGCLECQGISSRCRYNPSKYKSNEVYEKPVEPV